MVQNKKIINKKLAFGIFLILGMLISSVLYLETSPINGQASCNGNELYGRFRCQEGEEASS